MRGAAGCAWHMRRDFELAWFSAFHDLIQLTVGDVNVMPVSTDQLKAVFDHLLKVNSRGLCVGVFMTKGVATNHMETSCLVPFKKGIKLFLCRATPAQIFVSCLCPDGSLCTGKKTAKEEVASGRAAPGGVAERAACAPRAAANVRARPHRGSG